MLLEETYNIHKKLNCIFPFLKLKFLCNKGIHNYRIELLNYEETEEKEKNEYYCKITRHRIFHYGLKCYCCGKEIELTDQLY